MRSANFISFKVSPKVATAVETLTFKSAIVINAVMKIEVPAFKTSGNEKTELTAFASLTAGGTWISPIKLSKLNFNVVKANASLNQPCVQIIIIAIKITKGNHASVI